MGLLGRLNVKLSADTADFYSAMDKSSAKAQQSMRRIQGDIKRAGAVIGVALVAGTTAFAVKMKQIIDEADQMAKTSQRIGMTVESLSALKYAADLSGASFEELTKGMGRFARVVSDASNNLATAKRPFESLDISIKNTDGTLRDIEPLLLDVADRFSKIEDGTKKAALAQELFGRGGLALIPLLNEGKGGIEELRKEAEKLGIVLNAGTAKSAEEFDDNLTRLNSVVDGIFISIGNSLIPTLVDLSNQMLDNKSKADGLKDSTGSLAYNLIQLVQLGMRVAWVFQATGMAIGDLAAIASKSGLSPITAAKNWREIYLIIQKGAEDQRNLIDGLTAHTEKQWVDLQNTIVRISENSNVEEAVTKPYNRIQKLIDDIDNRIPQTESMMSKLGATFSSSFENAIMSGEKFSVLLSSLTEDIARIALRMMVLEPIFGSLFGTGTKAGLLPGFGEGGRFAAKTASAKGNAFYGGNVMAFANGGVLGGPAMFPMAGGRRGLAGEAGPEAILPLMRTSGGDLGVNAQVSGGTIVNVYAPAGSQVSQERKMEGNRETINIMIDEAVANNISRAGSRSHKALKSTFGLGQTLINR